MRVIVEWGLFILVIVFFLLHKKAKQTVMQIQREEIMREIVRQSIQKKKIDELYGRDRE